MTRLSWAAWATPRLWCSPKWKSATALLASIVADLGINPAASAMVARLNAAWQAAGTRSSRQRQDEAGQRVGDLPRTLPKGQHLDLARAFSKAHFELKDRDRPAASYLEWRLEQLEDGELQAEVMSKAESVEDLWGVCRISPDGTIRLQKGRTESSLPQSPD
eukprot:4331078-Heterocapsa_arctica.AAC.1